MSITTLVTFVEVFSIDINNNKSTKHLLQNSKREPSEEPNSPKNTILFNGKNYHYLPFIYQGTTINKSGDNIDNVTNILTTDTWLAASLSYDPEVVEVLLSSAIDAVGVNLPSLVLTNDAVGRLPVTSDIQNR